jgi:hypothetical protein
VFAGTRNLVNDVGQTRTVINYFDVMECDCACNISNTNMEYTTCTKGDVEAFMLAIAIVILMFITRAPRTVLITRAQIDRKKTATLVWVAAWTLSFSETGASGALSILFACAWVQCMMLDELIFCSVGLQRAGGLVHPTSDSRVQRYCELTSP